MTEKAESDNPKNLRDPMEKKRIIDRLIQEKLAEIIRLPQGSEGRRKEEERLDALNVELSIVNAELAKKYI